MRGQLAAFIERALPRGFSALLTLLLAKLTNPHLVGVYGFIILMYTAVQAATDTAARQVLMRVVREQAGRRAQGPAGEHFMHVYRRIVPALSFVLVMGLAVVLRLHGTIDSWMLVAEVLPQALAPTATAIGLHAVGILQAAGRWGVMAKAQFWASLASVAAVLPVMFVTRDLLAPALQTLLAESMVAWLCVRAARGVQIETHRDEGHRSIGSELVSMSTFSLMAWSQGQAERVLMGAMAGPSQLGIYGTASSVARAPGDALAASTANIVRTELALVTEARDIQAVANRVLTKALLLAAGGWAAAIMVAVALRPVMGPEWYPALDIVPVLAISAFPAVLTWPASAILLRAGRGWHTLWSPVAGIAMAIVIAWMSTRSLLAASYLVVARDLVTVVVAFVFIPRAAPWRAFALCCAVVTVLGIGTYVIIAR